jgi:hypothetical protein
MYVHAVKGWTKSSYDYYTGCDAEPDSVAKSNCKPGTESESEWQSDANAESDCDAESVTG